MGQPQPRDSKSSGNPGRATNHDGRRRSPPRQRATSKNSLAVNRLAKLGKKRIVQEELPPGRTKLVTVAMLEGRVRGLEKMSVVVRESNPGAQRFFHECGFRAGRITDELRGWFGTEDGVAMRRPVVLPIQSSGSS